MQVETVSTREVVSSCAIEMAIGVGWLLDQVDGVMATWRARQESGVDVENSAGNQIKRLALLHGWHGSMF